MRKFAAALLFFCLIPAICFSQSTVPVTGNLQDLTGSSVSTNSFVRFSLLNCGAFSPTVTGTGMIVGSTTDFHPNASGIINGVIRPNNAISCGGQASTAYLVQLYQNGAPSGPPAKYIINGAFNLNVPPAQATLVPTNQMTPVHGYNFRGAWSATTTYAQYDNVTYNGSSYVALGANFNQEPDTATTFWSLFASSGVSGLPPGMAADGNYGITVTNRIASKSLAASSVNGSDMSATDGTGVAAPGWHTPSYVSQQRSIFNNDYSTYASGGSYFEAMKNGHNSNPTGKNTFSSWLTSSVNRTSGQHMAHQVTATTYGAGDTIGTAWWIRRSGGTLSPGDEGLEGLREDIGQGQDLSTGTVSSIAGNTITVSNPNNWNEIGETRPLVNRNAAKSHTVASCSVVNVYSSPAQISCTGAALTTWYTTGSQASLCFELASAAVGNIQRTMMVRSVDSATQVTLNYQYAGNDGIWGADAPATGAGTFSRCSVVTDSSAWASNQVVVADPTVFAVGDAIEEGISPSQNLIGQSILMYPTTYLSSRSYGLQIVNEGNGYNGSSTVPIYAFINTMGQSTGAANTTQFMWSFYNGTILSGGTQWHNESTTPPSNPWFYAWSNNTSGCNQMVGTSKNGGSGATTISYCTDTANSSVIGWQFSTGFLTTDDGRYVLGPGGYPATTATIFSPIANVSWDGLQFLAPASYTGDYLRFYNHSGAEMFHVDYAGNVLANTITGLTSISASGAGSFGSITTSGGAATFGTISGTSITATGTGQFQTLITNTTIQSMGMLVNGVTPVPPIGYIGFGADIEPASNCGALSGSYGCYVIYVGPTQKRYIPIW